MRARVAVVFGQFGAAADPINLPHFRDRLAQAGVETILVQHTDSGAVANFLRGFDGFRGVVGSSLGAGAAPVMAGYLRPEIIDFVGGFQPSDWDPVMHPVLLHSGAGIITRAVMVPNTVKRALCFRNPILVGTAGLGHATYVLDPDNKYTDLHVEERADVHPGDFGPAQDQMFHTLMHYAQKGH